MASKFINKLITRVQHMWTGELSQELSGGDGDGQLAVPEIAPLCRQAAADGVVVLKNEKNILPLQEGETIALFGRCAWDYFAVGYGSGGDVKYPYRRSLADGLLEDGVKLDSPTVALYDAWRAREENIPNDGFWGHWPMSYPEMPLPDAAVERAAWRCKTAMVVIGRAAGEDRENTLKEGSYYLTRLERQMLDQVTSSFENTILIMDCGNLIDLSFLENYGDKITALVYAWQGGMEAGTGLADVLTGRVNPSGHLTDTIARTFEDYPSSLSFGARAFNNYVEDIYVGYRYFETFDKSRVIYPFGFGLSYTTFETELLSTAHADEVSSLTVRVTNTGSREGRHVVQAYLEAPKGKLGKAARVLMGFAKTPLLAPGESAELTISYNLDDFASFDDDGSTGHRDAWVLEAGTYTIFVGDNVRDAAAAHTFELSEARIRPVTPAMELSEQDGFDRLINVGSPSNGFKSYTRTPGPTFDVRERILEHLKAETKAEKAASENAGAAKESAASESAASESSTGSDAVADAAVLSFQDVVDGKMSLDAFVAALPDEDLITLCRGYGPMNYPGGPAGNAGAFGGTSESLQKKGVPAVITSDGPAGVRLKKTATLLPCGTALASSFDLEQVTALYSLISKECEVLGTNALLAPGMNIHRNPLCGRNFEYYSEDPYLSGLMAAAAINGLESNHVFATPKHFCGNNQEVNRNRTDSRISGRALREIYLKNFETMLRHSKPSCLMTSYNKVNGVWSHYNFDLATTILREEWGYEGLILTDWWMQAAASPEFPALQNCAYRVRAGVDVLMPGGDGFGPTAKVGNALPESLAASDEVTKKVAESGLTFPAHTGALDSTADALFEATIDAGITRTELRRTAKRVLRLALKLVK